MTPDPRDLRVAGNAQGINGIVKKKKASVHRRAAGGYVARTSRVRACCRGEGGGAGKLREESRVFFSPVNVVFCSGCGTDGRRQRGPLRTVSSWLHDRRAQSAMCASRVAGCARRIIIDEYQYVATTRDVIVC